jgi:hypothetical protein
LFKRPKPDLSCSAEGKEGIIIIIIAIIINIKV